jgi:hypothetical protein
MSDWIVFFKYWSSLCLISPMRVKA